MSKKPRRTDPIPQWVRVLCRLRGIDLPDPDDFAQYLKTLDDLARYQLDGQQQAEAKDMDLEAEITDGPAARPDDVWHDLAIKDAFRTLNNVVKCVTWSTCGVVVAVMALLASHTMTGEAAVAAVAAVTGFVAALTTFISAVLLQPLMALLGRGRSGRGNGPWWRRWFGLG